jgi:hypothetical protein
MLNLRTLPILVLLGCLGGAAVLLLSTRDADREAPARQTDRAQTEPSRTSIAPRLPEAPSSIPIQPQTNASASEVDAPASALATAQRPPPAQPAGLPATNPVVQQKAPAKAGGRSSKPPLQDPEARVALALVGSDEWAEAYWYEAINDPALPPHERQDLIEDLNEDGLSDPKHPTPDDLPLILSRLSLIEALGPDAMDPVNAAAFAEAYKDLLNLADLAMGGGGPVR